MLYTLHCELECLIALMQFRGVSAPLLMHSFQ